MLTTHFARSFARYGTRRSPCLARQCRLQSCVTSTQAPTISPAVLARARALTAEHLQLSQRLLKEYDAQVAKRAGSLASVASALDGWETANRSLPELQELIRDPATDSELRSIASEELQSTADRLGVLASQLQTALIPEHPFAQLPCFIEFRPGAGGDEAAIFAGDLLRMYQAYCKRHGIRTSLLKLDSAASAGSDEKIQEAVLEIETPGSYDLFRSEAGVHRVQRVPATEKQGRTHTSAASVMVLPSFPTRDEDLGELSFDDPDSDYYVNIKDVRIDTMRASGAGGQHVNKTDSAVRLTHIPTSTVVAMQDSRSQQQNRTKAWQVLRARLAQARREAREEERAQLRVSVVGVARMGRGDKVRTYNWSQQRVTDHRSGITIHNLDDMMGGGENLDKVIASVKEWLKMKDVETLIADEEAARLKT
ncbi:hypothetical protein MMC21_001673 [Puttea exsequens]|nr:hypothetical protein [Puttea exsequens]